MYISPLFCLTEVTLSALNAPESDVDIEGLGEASASKKLDFDSGKGFLTLTYNIIVFPSVSMS